MFTEIIVFAKVYSEWYLNRVWRCKHEYCCSFQLTSIHTYTMSVKACALLYNMYVFTILNHVLSYVCNFEILNLKNKWNTISLNIWHINFQMLPLQYRVLRKPCIIIFSSRQCIPNALYMQTWNKNDKTLKLFKGTGHQFLKYITIGLCPKMRLYTKFEKIIILRK